MAGIHYVSRITYHRLGIIIFLELPYLIDNAVKNPELIRERVEARQQELLEQGNGVMSEIVRAERENLTT